MSHLSGQKCSMSTPLNNQSPHNNHWVLVPWFPKGHLPKAPIRCLGMAHLSLAHIWEMCVSRGAR